MKRPGVALISPELWRRHRNDLVGPGCGVAAVSGLGVWCQLPVWLGLPVIVAALIGAGLWWQRPGARLRRDLGATGWMGLRQWWTIASARGARNATPDAVVAQKPSPAAVRPTRPEGAEVGRVVSGRLSVRGLRVFSPWSRGILVLGPAGSGKTSWLVNPILDAPGAAYVSSTKPELVHMTSRLRAEHGPVQVFNPTGLGSVPSTFRWDPVAGCTDPDVADARARALVRGGGGAVGGQQADFWAGKAAEIVRCYLLAAAVGKRDMGTVLDWALNPTDQTPCEILEDNPFDVPTGWLGTLQRNLGAAPAERSGYFAAVVPAVAFMDNALVAEACQPRAGEELDLAEFVANPGTLYVIAGEGDRRVAPLVTALTEAVFDVAKKVAAERGGRLSPSLTMFLDEIANTTPVPLDNWTADSRGWGITVCAVAQDLAQLESRWGHSKANTIFSNLPTKVVLPGVAIVQDLDRLAYLAGHRFVRQTSNSENNGSAGKGASRSSNHSWSREQVISGPMLYALPRWHAYVVGLGPRAVVVRFRPGYQQVRVALRRLEQRAVPVSTGVVGNSDRSDGGAEVVIPLRDTEDGDTARDDAPAATDAECERTPVGAPPRG